MSCNTVANDLYRESFKYFKNYVLPSASQPSSPQSNRKSRRSKVLPLIPGQEKDHGRNRSKGKGQECLENGERKDGGGDGNELGLNILGYEEPELLLRHPEDNQSKKDVFKRSIAYDCSCKCYQMWGLKSPETWNVMELAFPSGLIVIKNPFTPNGQRYWIARTLLDFPHDPDYITNMDNLNRLEKKKKGEPADSLKDFKLKTSSRDFYQTLRWVTFGYHHDWDTKVYTEERRSKFPEDLADMTKYISQILGFPNFEAEAAIANYYHMDSTLSGHVDRSEVNQSAPLFSISFGQSAIFLIGGKTKSERPQPVLLQSGDIAVMSGESRLSYHGVPKILPASSKPWDITKDPNDFNSCKRPKMEEDFANKVSATMDIHNCKSCSISLKDQEAETRNKVCDVSWTNFLNNFIDKSRINLNIRQVLFPGQNDLYSYNSETNIK